MPRSARSGRGPADVPSTPEALLQDAEKALMSGERLQRNREDAKATAYFQTVCSKLSGMREDRQGCLLWATAMANLVELKASSWSGSSTTADAPDLQLAATALERGHAAAVAAGAKSEERAHLLSARAECAGLLVAHSSVAEDGAAAVHWAAEATQLWEQCLVQEVAVSASQQTEPEPTVETLCSLGSASMAFGKLVLSDDGGKAFDTATRRAAQAAVKRSLDVFEEACGLCDSMRGDDLPDVLAQWAQALWEASEVVALHRRADLLSRAVDKAASSVRLQKVPVPESACLLGDILIAFGEHVWRNRSTRDTAAGPGTGADENGAAARVALWHCRRALHEGYGEAMRVRSRDLSVLCGMADALLDCARLQRDMLVCLVDLQSAQPATIVDGHSTGAPSEGPLPAQPPPVHSATSTPLQPPLPSLPAMLPAQTPMADCGPGGTELAVVDLAEAVDQMQVDPPMQLVVELPEPPASLPALPSANDCLERAASHYKQVLDASSAEWAGATVSRLDTMYNAACACALRGNREADCANLLGALATEGALRRADLEADVDLAPLVATAWMQSLLRGLP